MDACHYPLSTRRLWSLWDMLETWGYRYFAIGLNLAYAESALAKEDAQLVAGGVVPAAPRIVDPNAPVVAAIMSRCAEIEKFCEDESLDPIPGNIAALRLRLDLARGPAGRPLLLRDLLDSVTQLKNDFFMILHNRYFYSLGPGGSQIYGKPELFGALVAKKFPKARKDIEHAGNCLALGEATACVIHLNRAMEIATRRLASKLHITPDAKDSWGMVLGRMSDPIKAMADNTPTEKRKKEKWAECRANLYHVKMAWRDPGAHGTESYDEKEASDIFRRTRDFMQQLATLL